jgi:hypothetical protein
MSFNLFSVTRPELDRPPPGNRLLAVYRDPHFAWLDPRNGLRRQPPFAYRIVTPLLARAASVPIGIDSAYYLVSFLALAGAATFVGLAIFELAGSLIPALAGAVAFLVNPFTAPFNLRDYMLTDPMAFLLSALAIWALVKRRPVLFFSACAVGVMNKESMLPMLAAYPLSAWWIHGRPPRGAALAALAIAGGWVLFRVALPIPVDTYSILDQLRWQDAERMAGSGLVVFGVLAPAALRRPWRRIPLVSLLPFALGALLAAWFVDNLERAMAQALTAVCVGIFWLWPSGLRPQILALAPLPLAIAAGCSYELALPHRLSIIAGLSLLAGLAELRVWRLRAA